jgi:superfamily II DNA or RNA helicase
MAPEPSAIPSDPPHATPPVATIPVGDEARQRIAALLHFPKHRLPEDLLTRHIDRIYGASGWAICEAAAQAIRRRMQIAAEQGLRVVRRPTGLHGDYQTARRGKQHRPWTTRLYALEPLRASCGCPDFCTNSLGLCKHVLAVLVEVHRRPRTLAAWLQQAPPAPVARLTWDPIKPLHGDGDWLARVRLEIPERGKTPAAWHKLVTASQPGDDYRTLRATAIASQLKRPELVQSLRLALRRDADPALASLVAEEHERLTRARALAPLAKQPMPRSWKRRLFPYQQQGVDRFLASGQLLLADDMGLGKTTQAIAIMNRLWSSGLVRRGLLVVPAALKGQWQREWRACHDLPLTLIEGAPERRAAIYQAQTKGFLITNYEQLLRDLELARSYAPDFMLLDEAQRIKNWETRTAATIKQLQPRFRLVLTGTPFENRLAELDSILEWLDRRPLEPTWRLAPFHQDGDGRGMRNLDVLRERLATVLIRRRRQEVLEQLPGRADTRVDVPLTEAQRDEHDARAPRIARLLSTAQHRPLTRPEFLALMQLFTEQRIVTNGLAQLDHDEVWPGLAHSKPTPARLESLAMPKLGELRQLLQQIVVQQGRKVIVFSQWRRALQLAAWGCSDLFADAGVRHVFFTGAEPPRRRDDNVVAFHDDPDTRVLFATDAGGVGLNLQKAASCCVHFDLPWNPAVFEQRVGRIWRLGQTEKVDVWSLVGEDCIESRIAEVLGSKQAAFKAVFDGVSDAVDFERQQGFLATARRIVAAETEASSSSDDSVESLPLEPSAELATAPPDLAPTISPANSSPPTAAEKTAHGTSTTAAPPARVAADLRSVLAGLSVTTRPDGGLVLQADRESSATLVQLLRGLASAIERGSETPPAG